MIRLERPDGRLGSKAGYTAQEAMTWTIEQATGGSVTAKVTDRTDVDCATGATLNVGAKIHEATLRLTSSGAEWREIEVLVPAS